MDDLDKYMDRRTVMRRLGEVRRLYVDALHASLALEEAKKRIAYWACTVCKGTGKEPIRIKSTERKDCESCYGTGAAQALLCEIGAAAFAHADASKAPGIGGSRAASAEQAYASAEQAYEDWVSKGKPGALPGEAGVAPAKPEGPVAPAKPEGGTNEA